MLLKWCTQYAPKFGKLSSNHRTGNPSPPLALSIVMLSNAHFTSHYRISGSSWVITPWWLYGSLRSLFFCVFLPPFPNTFFFCYVYTIYILHCAHLCIKCSLGISNLLEEISSLSLSVVFLYFFALIIEEGFLTFLAILWNTAFRWVCLSFSPLPSTFLLLSGICKASSDNHFALLYLFFFRMVFFTASCIMLWTYVYSSSGTLNVRSNPLNLFVTSTV